MQDYKSKMRKKKQTKSLVVIIDPVQYFMEKRRDAFWTKHEKQIKKIFHLQLKALKLYIDNDADPQFMQSFAYRLGFGYWGLGKQGGITSGIFSMDTLTLKNGTTMDHLLGAQLIGKTVHEAFEKSGFDETYMVNTWLYENLWLWMTIKVTKEEHHPDNISKTVMDVELKKRMSHYNKVSTLVAYDRHL